MRSTSLCPSTDDPLRSPLQPGTPGQDEDPAMYVTFAIVFVASTVIIVCGLLVMGWQEWRDTHRK